ncbi:MAG: hypothetical protein RLZZ188_1884 [Verrucomicrobiota bacterium]
MSVVIRAENVSKKYVISHLAKQQTLRDAMHHGLRLVWRRLRWNARLNREEFWALKDVSFEVKQGEVLGIIGRNGAGKSTLLKILSRITEPTTGRISINGRVASLLEVGTGFHPELTGRENIFLNGAILGMTRAEVRAKFDEIVAFAEIDQFIDTPVKRYSSGMYVRLAFAVAAHLEPEILIVDEVLAVGDAQFQAKCLGKMQDVARNSGRTVLFVSHNLYSLRPLCHRGLLLKSGRVIDGGPIDQVLALYQHQQPKAAAAVDFPANPLAPSITRIEVDQAELGAGNLSVHVYFRSPIPLRPPVLGVIISTQESRPLFGANMRTHPSAVAHPLAAGVCTLHIPQLPLHSSTYQLSVFLGDKTEDFDRKVEVIQFVFTSLRHYQNLPPLQFIGHADFACSFSARGDAGP